MLESYCVSIELKYISLRAKVKRENNKISSKETEFSLKKNFLEKNKFHSLRHSYLIV